MANRKSSRKLSYTELEERAQQRSQIRSRRWQKLAFVLVSAVVLLSMIVTLFIRF